MGKMLVSYYDEAGSLGLQARMKLAMLTKIPSAKAADEPDSPESVKLFRDAMAQIRAGVN